MRWCRLLRKSDMIKADLNHLSVIPLGLLSDPHPLLLGLKPRAAGGVP
jgi:hypothetical protein